MQINFLKSIGITVFCLIVVIGAAYAGTSDTVDYLNGIKAYQEGDYQAAITDFSKITRTGTHNGELFYNLGNAYLKHEDIGRAVLWFERAHQLMPRDPDIKFNLDYARGLVKDKAEEKISPLIKSVFFWNYILSFTEIIWLSIVCVILFWIMTFFRGLYEKRFNTTGVNIFYYAVLTVSIILVLTCCYNYYQRTYMKEAVILPDHISIRSGLSDNSTELFVLHAGSKVRIQSEKKDYVKIYFSSGKLGWIKRSAVGIIIE